VRSAFVIIVNAWVKGLKAANKFRHSSASSQQISRSPFNAAMDSQ